MHVDDIQPLFDVSGVQAYCINSRRAVLIHPKVGAAAGLAERWAGCRPVGCSAGAVWRGLARRLPACCTLNPAPPRSGPPPLPQNVEKEQKCPAFDHSCLGCHKPLRHDCTFCSLRCKVDVEFGLAPITPKGGAAGALLTRDTAGGSDAVGAAVAAAVAAAAQPRYVPAGRLTAVKRLAPSAAAAASSLDVSHATRTSSGLDASRGGGKRRKAVVPERSFVA